MGSPAVVRDVSTADARLTVEVAAACVAAIAIFVVLPSAVDGFVPPAGLDSLWATGGLLTIVLGPVVSGLCGYVSLSALWMRGDVLTTPARRLHLVTLLVVAVVWLGLVSSWGSGVVSWWAD